MFLEMLWWKEQVKEFLCVPGIINTSQLMDNIKPQKVDFQNNWAHTQKTQSKDYIELHNTSDYVNLNKPDYGILE